ncbi:signal peptidase I [Cognatilysobacter bugurensis]|uniref:Signal peptidase I n=1 Tax=Cognatilysobacter bugurensis TaxID=543356 RepID=A0A918W9U1_9GAMM|nr:signal peptidase I [Lysobacter bugurensis]GHA86139.1 signal peptidase I [Lysobacter bugurensis]
MHTKDKATRRSAQLREVLSLLGLVGLMFVARSSFANHYVVPTGSMEGTLVPGDRVVVDMSAYGLRVPYTEIVLVERDTPTPGDVVLLPSPADGTRLIKRVVGAAGDHVAIRDGHLILNGKPAALDAAGRVERIGRQQVPVKLVSGGGPDVELVVPPGHVYVVGDHRGSSFDSRMFGLVPQTSVYARAQGVFWRSGEGPVWKDLH